MPLDPKQQPPYYTPGTQGLNTNKYTRINTQLTTVQTSGTTETDLYLYTIPANTLINDGDLLKITFVAVQNTPAESHEQRFYFNGTQQFNMDEELNTYTIIEITILKKASTTALMQFQGYTIDIGKGQPYIQIDATIDFTIPIPIKFTGQCTGLAFIQTYYMTIDKITI